MSYIKRELIKVTDSKGKITYYAVTEKTGECMLNSSIDMQYMICDNSEDYKSKQFDCDKLGTILVEQNDDD